MKQTPPETPSGIPIFCQCDKLVDPKDVKPSEHHKREHPPEHVEKIWRIIQANGWRSPCVISKRSGKLTKGRGRYLAALENNDKIPVVYQVYESEQAEVQDIIADNAAPDGSIDNTAAIAEAITTFDADPEAFGFTEQDIEAIMNDAEKSVKQRKPRAASGWTYKITFDSAEQKATWEAFLRKLQIEMPGRDTVAMRITEYISPYAAT